MRLNPVWAVLPMLLLAMFIGFALVDSEEVEGKTCSNCGGSGSISTSTECSWCDGSGISNYGDFGVCPKCNGVGEITTSTTCSTCGGSGTVADPHTHSYYISDRDYGDCSGCVYTYECSCGDSYTSGTKYDSHNYQSQGTTYGTCSGSQTTYKCSRCGDSYSSGTIYNSHNWGSWTTTKYATCTDTGTQKHTCSRCSATGTQAISALGHSYSASTYTWGTDYSECTVKFVCSRDSSHTGTSTVQSTSTTSGNATTYTVSGTDTAYNASYSQSTTVYTHTATLQYAVGTELLAGFAQTESTTGTSSTASGSATFTIQSGYPTITGRIFLGWSLSDGATSADYQPEGSITVPYGSTVTLYAVLQAAQLTIDSEPPTTAKVGQEWTYAPFTDASGFTLSVSGADWLNVTADGMAVYGTPAAAGSYDVTITMSKDGYADAVQPFTLTVYSALAFAHVPSSAGVFVYAG